MTATEEPARFKRRTRLSEYSFTIDAYSPETIPMARLAEYMAGLSTILGEPGSVHFVRVEGGSTDIVHQIEHEAIPKVRMRTNAVRRGEGPPDAQKAFRGVNTLLREDNATGLLREHDGDNQILEFPGVREAEEPFPAVSQQGSISGIVIRVGGTGSRVPVLMESEGKSIAGCHASREVAKRLGSCLFDPVRLHGQGYWMRDEVGEWSLNRFRIDHFEPLSKATLPEALTELRTITTERGPGAYEELLALRHGRAADGGN